MALTTGGAASAIDRAALVDLLGVLAATPAPWGRERPAADAVAGWLAAAAPHRSVVVQPFGRGRANVVVGRRPPGHGDRRPSLWVYSHLDTSLGGTSRDVAITGRADVAAHSCDGVVARGLGLAVARGPLAAATVGVLAAMEALDGLAAAAEPVLVLVAGGTHHRAAGASSAGRFGEGARCALARLPTPAAVLVAKSGPAAVLREEPGCAYLDVVLHGPLAPAMQRASVGPGAIGRLPAAIAAVERVRGRFVGRDRPGSAVGRELAMGAVAGGDACKCDLLPAQVRLSLTAVLGHGDDPHELAAELAGELADDGGPVEVSVGPWLPASATPPEAAIVGIAQDVVGAPLGAPRWRGSTDAAVFRQRGIDTARWGPTITASAGDPRVEEVEVDALVAAARSYGEIAARYCLGADTAAA